MSKSPKIDQFYRSIRNYMSASDQGDDKSIQEIRIIGNQILGHQVKKQTSYDAGLKLTKQSYHNIKSSSIQALKNNNKNLYDKYKYQNQLKTQRKIVQRTQQIANQRQQSVQKYWKNPKYQTTRSKFLQRKPTNTLNYEKRVNKKKVELKKIQLQAKRCKQRQIQRHNKFKRVSKVENKVDKDFKNVLKRGNQLAQKKTRLCKTLRNEQLQKQMIGVTFQPRLVSKQCLNIEKKFEKRQMIKEKEKKQKQRTLIKEIFEKNTFTPKINKNSNVKSITKRIWDNSPQTLSKQSSIIKQSRQMAAISQKQLLQQLPTANQSTRVTIRNQSQIQFLMNQ